MVIDNVLVQIATAELLTNLDDKNFIAATDKYKIDHLQGPHGILFRKMPKPTGHQVVRNLRPVENRARKCIAIFHICTTFDV